jgi:glyoxylase-like metal-dependent hydrolase (beta-lactamase superfamily II)
VKEISHGVFMLLDRNVFVYLIKSGEEGLVIDAGFDETARMLVSQLESVGVRRVARVLLTHGHGDHYEGAPELKRVYGADIGIHPADARLIAESGDYVLMRELSETYPGLFSVPEKHAVLGVVPSMLRDGEHIRVGSRSLRVLHTPGHSDGCACFLDEEHGLLFSGDAVSGDFVHFYGKPQTVDASLARLEGETFGHLLMAHPYPPENANLLSGSRARSFLARSREACVSAMARVTDRLRGDPAIGPQKLAEELKGPTLISVIKMMESARDPAGTPERGLPSSPTK